MQSPASPRSVSNVPLPQRVQRHWREGVIATNLAIAMYIAIAPRVDYTVTGVLSTLAIGVGVGVLWVALRSAWAGSQAEEGSTWIIDRSEPAPGRASRPSIGAALVPPRESFPSVRSALRAAPSPASIAPGAKPTSGVREVRRSSLPPPRALVEPARASAPAASPSTPSRGIRHEETAGRRISSGAPATKRSSDPSPALHVVTANLATAPNLTNGASVLHPSLLSNMLALRTELFMLAAQECFVLGVSSDAARKSVKSEFAAQLAVALAEPGQARVLLIEADPATPSVDRFLTVEVPRAVSFSQQLLRHASEGERTWAVLRIAKGLDVLAEGRMRTPGMLYAPAFSNALSELRRQYDLIVADGPVVGSGDSARAFEAVTDGVAFLTSGESTAREPRERAFMQFHTKRLFKLLSAG